MYKKKSAGYLNEFRGIGLAQKLRRVLKNVTSSNTFKAHDGQLLEHDYLKMNNDDWME